MEGNNKKDLKAYVRYDGSGRVVAGSLVLRRSIPKVGKWKEIQAYECCNPTTTTSTTTVTPTTTTTTSTTALIYRSILLSDGPLESPGEACATTTGVTKYIDISSVIAEGLIIYNDPELTIPIDGLGIYGASYVMLYDNNNALRYEFSFTYLGGLSVIDIVNSCT